MLIAYSFPNTVPFTTFTVTIIHLVYHPNVCLSIVFMLSWEDYNPPPPPKIGNNAYAKRLAGRGVNKVYYGNVKVANYCNST